MRSAHLRAAVDTCSDGIVLLDAEGRARDWNKSATRLLASALQVEEGAVLAPAFIDTPTYDELLLRCLQGETIRARRMEVGGDGRRSDVLLTLVPLGPPGEIAGCTMVLRDISEQVTSQEALAEGERRVRRAEALAHTGTFVVDARNGFAQWSEGMYRLHGIIPAGFGGGMADHLAIVAPHDRFAVEQLFRATLAGQVLPSLDHRVRHPDGSEVWLSVRAEPMLDSTGSVVGLSGVCQDVSARIESEAVLQQALEREQDVSQELRRLDVLKDEFLATASHELRTPLTSIMGFAALLEETMQGNGGLVEPIQRNAREMHHLIEALLDQARLQSGERSMSPTRFPLEAAVRSLIADHDDQFAGCTVVVQIPEDAKLEMDREAFDLVLGNLAGNAAKYAPGSTVTISAETADDGVTLRVSDDGPGIDGKHLGNLFEPFYRVPGSSSTVRGSGLGLAIVRRYVQLHGGSVTCESALGQGTTFTVSLPLSRSPGQDDDL